MRTFKYRIKPTKEQKVLIEKHLGCCRYVWNTYLWERKKAYEEDWKTLTYYDNAKALTQLKKIQRYYSRHKWKRSLRKLQRLHSKVANQRKDFLHKLSTKLINENQVICLEDLNVKGMMKNHRLAKSISDVGWWMFITFLQYKAEWHGRNVIIINRYFPSSKTCNCCGNVKEELKLSERMYHWESCWA